ncbi:hypothetical protein ACJIZ3_013341 [Penstemon smallii]|uniref:Protection of telomeres protein 1 n=1 Tax=Penstemon smallii TaxID=265156 RepID=A0ABD3UPM9_9LAMI
MRRRPPPLPQIRRPVGDWRWVKLNELMNSVGSKVDILGIVVECGIPHKSKGTDYCVILKIIDDGGTNLELSVNAFHRNIKDLPCVRGHLDVILFHNALIDSYDQTPAVSFRRTSSFALFDGRDTVDCEPYQISPGFQGLGSAKNLVRNLRSWSSLHKFDAGISPYVVPLADIAGRLFIDLVCKVLYVHEVSEGKWMLFVWDGTDAPPVSLTNKLTDEEQILMPLHIESFSLPAHVLHNFPYVGTVLRILVDESYEDFGVYFHHNEKWVRLRNLMCKTESGLFKGIFTLETKFRPLSEEDDSVKKCLRICNERIREEGRVPSASIPRSDILTVTDNEQAKYSTLMDLLCSTLPHAGFKCVVRVVAVYPSQAKDFRSPEGFYRVRLTLEDPTTRIHAYLSHEDAVYFFGGDPPDDVLTTKLNKLMGVVPGCEESPRWPPWVECCIGYKTQDVNNLEGKRFHVCHTKFTF